MEDVRYIGENSSYLDKYGPIKMNVIGRWTNIGLGDQILHGYSMIMFLNTIIKKFPNLFNMKNIHLFNLFGPLIHVDNIRKMDDAFCEIFIPFKNGKPINKPRRLYQLDAFKFFHGIRDAETVLGKRIPEHINLVTGKQQKLDMYKAYHNMIDINDKNLVMKIINASRSDEVQKGNNGWVNVFLNFRILGTRVSRREFAETYLDELYPTFQRDEYTLELLDKINRLKKDGKCAGCIHYRLTDTTLVQKGDPDPSRNGKAVETCLGPQETSTVFNIKVSKWITDLSAKYRDKGGTIFVFSDDFAMCKKRYKRHLERMSEHFEVQFVDKRSLRTMFTESWQDYLVMRECNEHCGSISMFGLWVKSYGPFEDEVITVDHHVFQASADADNSRIRAYQDAKLHHLL